MNKDLKKYFPLFLLPTLAAFVLVFLVPFIMGVFLSFTSFTAIGDAQWVGLENYIKAFFHDDSFTRALWFTVKFTAVSVVTVNVGAFALALLLTGAVRGRNAFRTVFFMPNLIGGIVLGYIWNLIINGILGFWGVDITYAAKYGFWGLVALMNWQLIGYMMVIYIAGLQNIPRETLQAASVDGAGKWQTLRHITVPMMAPSFTIGIFLTLTNSFKLFDQNLALTAGAPGGETEMLALNIYNTFYGRTGWQGAGQAKAVVFFLIVAAAALVQFRLTARTERE